LVDANAYGVVPEEGGDYVLGSWCGIRDGNGTEYRLARGPKTAQLPHGCHKVAPKRLEDWRIARFRLALSGLQPGVSRIQVCSTDAEQDNLRGLNSAARRRIRLNFTEEDIAGLAFLSQIGYPNRESPLLS